MFDQFVFLGEQIGYIRRGSGEAAVLNLDGCALGDFHFAGPLGLVAGHFDLRAGGELFVIRLGADCVVDEICAVLILCVEGSFILPPRLLRLHVCLDYHFAVKCGSHVLVVGHNALGFLVFAAVSAITAGGKGQSEGKCQCQCDCLFHNHPPQ